MQRTPTWLTPHLKKKKLIMSVNIDLPQMHLCVCVCAGEAHSIAGCSQRSSDERSDAAEGALQHADPQWHLPHQPHQTADY